MLGALLTDIKRFLTLLIISILLILLDNFGALNFFKSALQIVTVPIQYGLYKTSNIITNQFEFIILARRASQENKALTDQLAQVSAENARLQTKLAEAEGFLAQQSSLDAKTFNLIAARPIGASRYLFIDKGTEAGIKVDQAVVFKDNLIGKIQKVSPKRSEVLLTVDPDFKLGAFTSNAEGKGKGILLGQFGTDMLLDKILHQEPVKKNDLVYTEGTELEIPRGLIIGQVSEVISVDNAVFKQAKVKSMFDIGSLDVVFVITN